MAELEALGCQKENVNLVQLSFWVTYDETRKEFIDTACWVDLESGEISMTYNYRPIKALKYVKEEDSVFDKLRIAKLVKYPGEGNPRVLWEGAEFLPILEADLCKIRSLASSSLKNEGKMAKNLLKNPLSDYPTNQMHCRKVLPSKQFQQKTVSSHHLHHTHKEML